MMCMQEAAVRVLRKKRAEGEPGKLEALTKASVDLAQVQPVVCCHTRLAGLLLTFVMIDAAGIPPDCGQQD